MAVDAAFLLSCRDAVRFMREAGMNETMIANVINDVRSAAITEENRRLRQLIDGAPPQHYPWPEMREALTHD